MWLYYFLAGILFWQIVVIALYYISRENEELSLVVSTIVPLVILKGVYAIIHKLWVKHVRRTYKVYEIINENGHSRTIRIKFKWLNQYNTKPEHGRFYLRELSNIIQIENAINIKQIKKIKNGWFNEQWINENLKKATA